MSITQPATPSTASATQPVAAPPGHVVAWRWRTDPPTPYPTRLVSDLPGFDAEAAAASVRLSRFGGWLDRRAPGEPPGFFRTTKVGDRWWLVDPDGYLFLHVAMNGLSIGKGPQAEAAFDRTYTGADAWRDQATAQMWDLGFNGTGAWSADKLLATAPRRLAYAPTWTFMHRYGKQRGGTYPEPGHLGYPNKCIFVFDPEFEAFAEETARQFAATKDDPYLLGHFTDNELPFPKDALDRFLQLPETDPGRQAAAKWFTEQTGRPAPPVTPWVKAPATKPSPEALAAAAAAGITDALRLEFQGYVIDRYLTIVCGAIRKYDPNHMILGPRFYGDERDSEPAFRAIGQHVEVIPVNLYHHWTPGPEVRNWERWSGRPCMITEWYAKGMDSGLTNLSGAGYSVYTQADRGKFYQNFTLGLLETKACVGWHWFKYMDNDPTDPKAEMSNKDSNKGILTTRYEPYEPLVRQMRELNRAAYPLTGYFDARK